MIVSTMTIFQSELRRRRSDVPRCSHHEDRSILELAGSAGPAYVAIGRMIIERTSKRIRTEPSRLAAIQDQIQ